LVLFLNPNCDLTLSSKLFLNKYSIFYFIINLLLQALVFNVNKNLIRKLFYYLHQLMKVTIQDLQMVYFYDKLSNQITHNYRKLQYFTAWKIVPSKQSVKSKRVKILRLQTLLFIISLYNPYFPRCISQALKLFSFECCFQKFVWLVKLEF